MIGLFELGGQALRVNFAQGVCLAIPLVFAGPQPSHFGALPATSTPMATDGFIGDTRQGGACNVPVLTLNPHCNGTHTESVAHIVDQLVPIHQVVPCGLIPATLITLTPVQATASSESYRPELASEDRLITASTLQGALPGRPNFWLEAVILRTLPNGPAKCTQRYGEQAFPPFFTLEAMDLLIALDIKHLLVDIPSVDKMYDEGLLTIHHRFWQIPEGSHSLNPMSRRDKTITEMIYVPDTVPDGRYLLSLQIPAFCSDVAPSRPWLYPVELV